MEALQDDAFYYGYHKITHNLRRKHNLIINHKKVYRLCKELQILRNQRVIKPQKVQYQLIGLLKSRMSFGKQILNMVTSPEKISFSLCYQ